MDTIFKFLHSIMFTLTLQISKLEKAVVLNFFPHGRFWQFVYKENVRCTRLMQRSLQVVIRQMFVLCSLKIDKLLSQMNWNLVGSNYGGSSIKIAHFIPIRWQTWSPQTILVPGWPISNNLLLWNCLAKWAEFWWEAPIEGSVCIKFPQSRMKGERHRLRPLSLYFQWAKNEHLSYYNL
jgi:hypothetical protein